MSSWDAQSSPDRRRAGTALSQAESTCFRSGNALVEPELPLRASRRSYRTVELRKEQLQATTQSIHPVASLEDKDTIVGPVSYDGFQRQTD